MPLSDVRAGMDCTGLSVVRGTEISEFSVEVLDVIRGDSEAPGPRLLVRVSGPAVDATGVGPGFSGSPILCPDAAGVRKNAGAISETLGEFGNKVVLATPIEQILGQGPEVPRSARRDPATLRRARAIATPLTFAGLSATLRSRVNRAARRAGSTVLAAPSGPFAGFPQQDLRPGASVSAGLSSGDVGIGAVGTVAYRNGSAVWAFGHSLDGAGRRSLLLQDAYVFAVINNPLGFEGSITSKLAVPGRTVGAVTNDGLNQVAGRIGAAAGPIPVRVNVRNTDTGRTAALHSEAADERSLELGSAIDLVSTVAVSQAAADVLGSTPPRMSAELCVRIRVRERTRRLGFCDEYLEASGPFEDTSSALGLIDSFKFGRLTPTDVSIRMAVKRDVKEAFILAARAPRRVRPGQRIRIRLVLQRRRGPRTVLSFPYRVPRSLGPGLKVLTLRGVVPASLREASEEGLELILEGFEAPGGGDGAGPRSIRELASKISALGAPDGVRATFRSRGRGPIVLRNRDLLIRGKTQVAVRVARR